MDQDQVTLPPIGSPVAAPSSPNALPPIGADVTHLTMPAASGTADAGRRGFLSATKDLLRGLPDTAKAMIEEGGHTLLPSNPELTERHDQRIADETKKFTDRKDTLGLAPAIVRGAGDQMGIPSDAIAKDYGDKNWSALAGDVAAPLVAGEAMRRVPEAVGAAKKAYAARVGSTPVTAMPTTTPQLSALSKAIEPSHAAPYTPDQMSRAMPYLEDQHAQAPISSVQHMVDAADASISGIESKIASYVQPFKDDILPANPSGAAAARLKQNPRASAMGEGMSDIRDLGLTKPQTVGGADAMRRQLNAENKAVLKRNNYDQAIARQTDPMFAAREAAAEELRDSLYTYLEQRGIPGVGDLRSDEGALISVRNAGQRQLYSGDKPVARTGTSSAARKIGGRLAQAGMTGAGAAAAGPAGAIVGAGLGEVLNSAIAPSALTRDQLVQQAFTKKRSTMPPVYPTPRAPTTGQTPVTPKKRP